jgi:protein SCO1/2
MRARAKAAVLLGAFALALAGCGAESPKFRSSDVTGATFGRDFALTDPSGNPRTLADFRGKVVVLFFGYTQCPDVCPTTLAELAAVKRDLGKDGDRVQGVFVSVDPQRDTPQILKAYMASFDPGFVALRGTPEQVKETARQFKVFYAQVPGRTEGSYTVDHTAGTYVFDAQGKVRLFVRYGSGAEALRHDLKLLLDENPA